MMQATIASSIPSFPQDGRLKEDPMRDGTRGCASLPRQTLQHRKLEPAAPVRDLLPAISTAPKQTHRNCCEGNQQQNRSRMPQTPTAAPDGSCQPVIYASGGGLYGGFKGAADLFSLLVATRDADTTLLQQLPLSLAISFLQSLIQDENSRMIAGSGAAEAGRAGLRLPVDPIRSHNYKCQ